MRHLARGPGRAGLAWLQTLACRSSSERRRREGLAGLRGGQRPVSDHVRSLAPPSITATLRAACRALCGVVLGRLWVRHAPKGVGWVLLTRISRLTRRGFCCCCWCTGPRRWAVTAAVGAFESL